MAHQHRPPSDCEHFVIDLFADESDTDDERPVPQPAGAAITAIKNDNSSNNDNVRSDKNVNVNGNGAKTSWTSLNHQHHATAADLPLFHAASATISPIPQENIIRAAATGSTADVTAVAVAGVAAILPSTSIGAANTTTTPREVPVAPASMASFAASISLVSAESSDRREAEDATMARSVGFVAGQVGATKKRRTSFKSVISAAATTVGFDRKAEKMSVAAAGTMPRVLDTNAAVAKGGFASEPPFCNGKVAEETSTTCDDTRQRSVRNVPPSKSPPPSIDPPASESGGTLAPISCSGAKSASAPPPGHRGCGRCAGCQIACCGTCRLCVRRPRSADQPWSACAFRDCVELSYRRRSFRRKHAIGLTPSKAKSSNDIANALMNPDKSSVTKRAPVPSLVHSMNVAVGAAAAAADAVTSHPSVDEIAASELAEIAVQHCGHCNPCHRDPCGLCTLCTLTTTQCVFKCCDGNGNRVAMLYQKEVSKTTQQCEEIEVTYDVGMDVYCWWKNSKVRYVGLVLRACE